MNILKHYWDYIKNNHAIPFYIKKQKSIYKFIYLSNLHTAWP